MDIEIQTYWNVETLYYVFNAVAAVMTGAGFAGLLKMVFLFAIGIGIFAYAGNKQLEMATWFIHALVFTTVLNLPIAHVAITDKTGLEPPRVVDNVPFALAVVAQSTNLTFGFLTRTYETVFGVPEELGLQKGDVGFGHRILKQVNNATVRDPGLRADLMQFIKECTLYDVKDGEITPQQIVAGTDTWNTVFNNTSPARFVTYNTLTNVPTTDTCTQVAIILKQRVGDAVIAGQTFYGKQVFTRATTDAMATSMFISTVGTSYDWILHNAQNASDAIKQSMFNNIWKEASTELPALLNDPARVAEVSTLASAAQAARQADGSNSSLSLLAQETLPHMRNWIEAIIYAIFPVIVVLMVVVSTEGAKKIIAGYMMSLAWIGLWPLLFAIINHLSLMHLRHKTRALELASGVPFQLSDAFDATLSNEQAIIGYMVVLVPFIAGGIIKMGQGGFMSVADRMMTGFASAGSAMGANHASGNISLGQTGLDTAAVNTTAMHKHDSNIGLSGGGAIIGRGNGSVASMAANGTVALQQMQNRMLTQMGIDKRFESSSNQEAHRTSITSSGEQWAVRHGDTSTLTDVKSRDHTRGHHQQTGSHISTTQQGGYGGQHITGESIDKNHREVSSFHMGAGATDQLNMSLGVSRGMGAGSSTSNKGAMPDQKEEQRIINGMKQSGASQQQIDQALHHYRSSKGHTSNTNSSFIHAGLGYHGSKNYNAGHARDRSVDITHGQHETAKTEQTFSVTGSHTEQASNTEQTHQTNRHSQDAALSNLDERSHIRDVSDRREYGTGDRISHSKSDSFSVHKDLMADPYLFEKVAVRNGMTAMRFANQSEDRIIEMVQNYASEKKMVEQASAMPQQTLSSEKIPTTQNGLSVQSHKDRSTMSSDITTQHHTKVAKTTFSGAEPLNVNTTTHPITESTKARVESQLDQKNKESIPARAGALDENVHAWASPDKSIGEGRANPASVTEEAIARDTVDTFKKSWDKLTGGDGTANGEKLNENMKRERGATIQINTSEKNKR